MTEKKILQTFLFLTLFGLLLITPIGKAAAQTDNSLQVTNTENATASYTDNQLLAMPQTTVYDDCYCTGGSITSVEWVGVSLYYLLQQAGLDSTVASVDFQASDGNSASLPLQEAIQANVIVAYEVDGSPLSGLRLVVPGENENVWLAPLTSITMSTTVTQSATYSSKTAVVVPSPPPIGQSSTQQTPVQSQPTATPQNQNSPEPAASPSNVTQPGQKAAEPKVSAGTGFPSAALYVLAAVAAVALAAAGYTAYKRKSKTKTTQST
ncbi:MAG: molybdopterin-dependent oxidoreductase [Candidatus Bathyarchaeia archaeon]